MAGGVLVKPFVGRLLGSYVLEKFDSVEGVIPCTDSSSRAGTDKASKSLPKEADKLKSRPNIQTGKSSNPSVTRVGNKDIINKTQQSPGVSSKNSSSPKNVVQTRSTRVR